LGWGAIMIRGKGKEDKCEIERRRGKINWKCDEKR
jgi:hypothetical protein